MNFPLKVYPHIRGNRTNNDILSVVIKAALFVAVWAVYNRFVFYGVETGVHVVLMIVTACLAGTFAHIGFNMFFDAMEKKRFASFGERILPYTYKIKNGETIVTGLILSLAMQPTAHIYVVAIVVIFAEVFGKLIYGGYGQNIFNPVAVGLIFNALTFGGTVLTVPLPYVTDALSQATPLAGLNTFNWIMTPTQAENFLYTNGGVLRMLLGLVHGSVGETSRLALLLALGYMIYKKVADWTIPAFYIGSVFLITLIYGLYIGAGLWYPIIHLLTGGLIFGATFLATDPVTTPLTRQGKAVFGILLAMFTLLIRFTSSHAEGVAFSILLVNMLVPFIDQKMYGITSIDINKKKLSVSIAFISATVIVIGFTILTNVFF